MHRLVVYTKDVMVITGRSDKVSRNLLKQIKVKFAKEAHQFITINEFCQFTGIPLETVEKCLKY